MCASLYKYMNILYIELSVFSMSGQALTSHQDVGVGGQIRAPLTERNLEETKR